MENGFGANKWYGFYGWKGKKKTKDFKVAYHTSGTYYPRVLVGYHSCSNSNCSRDGDPIYRPRPSATLSHTMFKGSWYQGLDDSVTDIMEALKA